jgi:hypothetical protein
MRRSNIVAAANGLNYHRVRRGSATRWSYHSKLLLVTFLGVVVGATTAWYAFPAIARADTCGQNLRYNITATDGQGVAHDGVRVANPGMYIYNHTASCREISSIESLGGGGLEAAEVGWIDIATGSAGNCNTTGDNTPYVMTAWLIGGTYHCFTHGSLTANQSDPFSVWGDSNDNWTWSHDGHNVQLATLDFRISKSLTNGERHSDYDSAQSDFNGMQNGTSPNWNAWTNSACNSNNDPIYNNQRYSATHIGVSTSPAQC